ncbi:MAG: MFS transporter [Bacteroidota bacterium]
MLTRTLQLYRAAYSGLAPSVWLLSLVMLINRSGAMVIPFLSLYLTSNLGFSLPQVGWVMSAFGLGSMAGSFIGGKLVDKIGHYQVQFYALFLSSFCFFAMIWVTSFWSICGMIFLTTTITDAFRPANYAAVASYTTAENRTRGIALIRMAINLGFAVGPALGGFLAYRHGFHYLFIADGVTCLFASAILAISLKNAPMAEPLLDKTPSETTTTSTTHQSISSPYRDRQFLFFMFIVLLNAVVFFQLFSTYPLFFREAYFLNESQIGVLMAFNGLIIAITEMPLIYWLEQKERFSTYRIIIVGTILMALAYWVLTCLPASMAAALCSMFLISVGEILSLPFISTIAVNRPSAENRGKYLAVFTMTYSLSHIIASNIGMQLTEHFDWNFMWYTMVMIAVFSCLGFWWIDRTEVIQQ